MEPKNISAVEDEDKVWVKFALPGFMESCQMYRKMGHCTDVKVHCFHIDSEDVTIYSAHNVLLSSASTYFSFVLVQAFTQLTDIRTSNLKKVLRIIKSDETYVDKAINAEENIIKFRVPLCHDKLQYCPRKHASGAFTDSIDSLRNKINSCVEETSESDILNVTIKSFNSANNIIMSVKGIDPIYIKYVLKCIYSESFFIEKKHIQLFLSFILQVKLTHFSTLTTLLSPFIATSNSQLGRTSTPGADSCHNCQLNPNSNSAFKFYDHKEEYTVLNSLYDIYQWSNTNEFRPTGMLSAPLDLSCKSVNNNASENHEHFPSPTEQLTNHNHCNTYDFSVLKIQNNVRHNSGFGNLNPYLWLFNSRDAFPTLSQAMMNISNVASANSCYNSGSNIYFQEANRMDSFWREYYASNFQNDLRAYIPDLNRYATFFNLQNESQPNYSNAYKYPNANCEVERNGDEPRSNLCNDRKNPPILEKLERNSAIEVKRLDVPLDTESGFENKLCFKRKTQPGDNGKIKSTDKKVKTDSRDLNQASCSTCDDNANSENCEPVNAAPVSTINEECLLNSCDDKIVLNPSSDSYETNNLKCFICDYSSYSINEIIFHMRTSHFSQRIRIAKCVDVDCPVQLLFSSKEWETHIQHHFIKYIYQCASCTYSTKTKKGILRHEMTHKSTYKRLQKEKKARRSKSRVGLKSASRRCVVNCSKLARIEQFPESKTSNEIQCSDVFSTLTFKKIQRGLKKRRNNCDALEKIHSQITKVAKGKYKMKCKKVRRSKKLSDSQVSTALSEETVNTDREVNVASSKEEKPSNEHQEFEGDIVRENVSRDRLDSITNSSSSSCGFANTQKIRTKTVRLLNKKKKFLHCTLCNIVLPSEEEMTTHYYISHNLILPFKCPYRGCEVYLDNTSLMYSHINIHAEEGRIQVDASSVFSLNRDNLK